MRPNRARVPSVALAIPLSLALSIQIIPSPSNVSGKLRLSPFTGGDGAGQGLAPILPAASSSLGYGVVSRTDLSAALGAQPRRFGIFRPDSSVDGQRELLRRVPFGAILAAAGERNHVDALLLAAVVESESQFVAHAVSHCGAVGLMQLLPSTGKDYGVKNLRDPYANIDAGSRYLGRLLRRFDGRADLALAAWNTGPEVVARFGCVPPYRETQDFVKRVLDRYDRYAQNQLPPARLSARPAILARKARGLSFHRIEAGRREERETAARQVALAR